MREIVIGTMVMNALVLGPALTRVKAFADVWHVAYLMQIIFLLTGTKKLWEQ